MEYELNVEGAVQSALMQKKFSSRIRALADHDELLAVAEEAWESARGRERGSRVDRTHTAFHNASVAVEKVLDGIVRENPPTPRQPSSTIGAAYSAYEIKRDGTAEQNDAKLRELGLI